MTTQPSLQFGVIGMAVMGRNLALNVVDHGFSVGVWNRNHALTEEAVAESGGRLVGAVTLEELLSRLSRPRRVMLMIQAGEAVDLVIAQLRPLLDPGDVIIDGGNSYFQDSRRRERELAEVGLRFFGVGVSGGEEGARRGPALMPGGDGQAYELIRPVLEAIAARSAQGACVAHLGPDGAGHFVKMVHNGIEYADMQLIAEAYHLLRELGQMAPPELAEVFRRFNQGPLESFLIELTARVLSVADGEGWLIDRVLDRAGQKGTGRWTVQVALELALPVPSIAAALDARVLSSFKAARLEASRRLSGPAPGADEALTPQLVEEALLASKVIAYAQGLSLIRAASDEYGWSVDLREVARIWTGGCIIRARLLEGIMAAYERAPALSNLLLDPALGAIVGRGQGPLRRVVSLAQGRGVPVPAMSASLAYHDSLRTAELPQNLTQAQRDAFGAHTYQRNDVDGEAPFVHTDWLGER